MIKLLWRRPSVAAQSGSPQRDSPLVIPAPYQVRGKLQQESISYGSQLPLGHRLDSRLHGNDRIRM
jgi:hypothetical protein